MQALTKPQRQAWMEIGAVVATGLLKLLLVNLLEWRLAFTLTAVVGWSVFLVWRIRQQPGIAKVWGFRQQNLSVSFRAVAWFAGVAITCFAIYGGVTGDIFLNWHILPLLITYPVWGIVQQFLIMSLVTGNLKTLGWHPLLIVALSAIVFGLVHLPDPLLAGGTTLLALFYSAIFLKWRNLWPLGLFHGWIGAFFYFLVLHRDPLLELLSF